MKGEEEKKVGEEGRRGEQEVEKGRGEGRGEREKEENGGEPLPAGNQLRDSCSIFFLLNKRRF